MSEPAFQEQPQTKSSTRPSVVRTRLRRLASTVIGELCASPEAATLPMPALAALPALCTYLVARPNLFELGSSMPADEARAMLAVRGLSATECDSVLLALRAVRLLVAAGEMVSIPLFDEALEAHLAQAANRSVAWGKRGVALETKALARPPVLELVPAAQTAQAQESVVGLAGSAAVTSKGAPSAARATLKTAKRPRPGHDHRFGASDSVDPDEADPTVARVQCECGGVAEITQSYIDHLQAAFRGVDALEQVRLAAVWCDSNASRRKKLTGVRRFLNSWLGTAAREASVRAAVVRSGSQRNGFGQGGGYGQDSEAETSHGQPTTAHVGRGDFDDLKSDGVLDGPGRHCMDAAPAVVEQTAHASPRVSAVVAARARATLRGRPAPCPQRRLSDQLS